MHFLFHLQVLVLVLVLVPDPVLHCLCVAVVLLAVHLSHTAVLALHDLATPAQLSVVVLVLKGAAATSEHLADFGHLCDGDHAGRVLGVDARQAGVT